MTDIKRFTFRIPLDLFNDIEKIATINHRSVNSQILIAIEDFLEKYQDLYKEQKELKSE